MNYLLFIIDSLNYSHVKESPIDLMPFFQNLKSEGTYCEHMYSQAPYTEAAVMSLYCGQDVLQNNGYLFRFKDVKTTLFEVMSKAGYVTYYNSYQPQCFPSSVRRGIDYLFYNVGYDQSALYSYRIKHYQELNKHNQLKEADVNTLIEIFQDNFSEWLRFIDDLINENVSTNMIRNNAKNYNPIEVKKIVSQEYDKFTENSNEYVYNVLKKGDDHEFFQIPAYIQNNKICDRSIIPLIQKEMYPLFKRIKSKNRSLNLKNCKGLFKGSFKKLFKTLCSPSRESYKELLKSIYLMVNEVNDLDLFQRINDEYDCFKNAPSGRTHIDHYINWAENQPKNSSHFACIHIDDIHNPEVFFTYDTNDAKIILSEKELALRLLNEIPKDYYGSLTHDLSLRYADNLIKYLYNELESHGMLENTIVCICADHGFSFSGNPLRDSFVNNFYLENYNIPFVITGAGISHKQISSLRSSKDIPATIAYIATGKVPDSFTGHSITEDYDYPHVNIEYCGGGCPDLTRRQIKLAAFDRSCFVGTLSTLSEPLDFSKITEIYDLINDPKQLRNLRNKEFNKEKVSAFLNYLQKRKNDIQNSMTKNP